MLDTRARSYEELVTSFRWRIPERLNIAEVVCDCHARRIPKAPAVIVDNDEGPAKHYSFAELKARSDGLASQLARLGLRRGDRLATTLPQGVEALTTLLATLKLGAIAVPIAPTYGTAGIRYRLQDSGAKMVVVDRAGLEKLSGESLPALEQVIFSGTDAPEQLPSLATLAESDGAAFECVATGPRDPALLFYTSGSTGPAKGVLHGHQFVLGHVPGFQMMFELAPRPGDVFWTPSVWAWVGSLGDVVFPALYFGYPVVASPARFSVAGSYRLMARRGVTCPFLATPVLRRMRGELPDPGLRFQVRAIATGGEPLAEEFVESAQRAFGCPVNDDFGLSEGNHFAMGCTTLFETPPGAIGRPPPARRLAVLDASGELLPPGQSGELALAADDPIVMLGYWNMPKKTAERLEGGWLRTGDTGFIDEKGFLYFKGRQDDLIVTSGHRVGPEEVEVQLLAHESVLEACVFGLPDGLRGEIVAAAIHLRQGRSASESLATELQEFVRRRLAAHAYPRRVFFVEDFPRTSTGKIQRGVLRKEMGVER